MPTKLLRWTKQAGVAVVLYIDKVTWGGGGGGGKIEGSGAGGGWWLFFFINKN